MQLLHINCYKIYFFNVSLQLDVPPPFSCISCCRFPLLPMPPVDYSNN